MTTTTEITKQDYQLAAEELAEFYISLKLEARVHGGHLETDAEKWQHHAYRVSFRKWGVEPQTFDWRQGTGCKSSPEPAEVLAACCRDHVSTIGQSFEEWAGNYGYDTDSRKAESVFRACQSVGVQLRALKLTTDQIQKLAELSNRL